MNLAARLAGVAALALALTVTPSAGALAATPKLTVSKSTLPSDQVSEITVTGRSYLVPPHAPGVEVFGGVYLFFGWVKDPGGFGPSIRNSGNNDGTPGVTYAYPGEAGDAGTRDDGSGTMRMVSFTTGGASGEATDFHMDDDGDWRATLKINGSTFSTTSNGKSSTYDCLKVQCGVYTIGAHGVASKTNEKFTRITFKAPSGGGTAAEPTTAPTRPAAATTTAPTRTTAPAAGATNAATATGTAESADLVAVEEADSGGDIEGRAVAGTRSVRSTGGIGWFIPLTALTALVVLAAGGIWWRRRRRRATPTTPLS
ncbi:hypothetical protein [Actinoplanes sp. G11-F43]|uniref:hypothetical protein n=1 Tax=Actinoplanes sp. G11-F43 TaxID=3424130 RepID=UPI003D32B961